MRAASDARRLGFALAMVIASAVGACGFDGLGGAPPEEVTTAGRVDGGADSADSAPAAEGGGPTDADAAPTCLVSPPGLVSWWTGDDTLGDQLGANDGASGSQGSGTVENVTFTTGVVDEAFDLGGTKYVQAASSTSLRFDAALTMEAWVNAPSFGGRIVDKITVGTSDGYMLDTYQNKLRIIIGPAVVSSPMTLPTNTWIHVAGTWDGTTARVYVNAAEVASVPATSLPANTRLLRIGADSNGNTRFSGKIDEVGIWKRALTATELAAIVAAGSRGRCK